MTIKFDFSGYATKNDLKCTDGRTIRKDAFKDDDGVTVPLVWQHLHDEPTNVLGHAVLENRKDGVYAYCMFNDSENGKHAAELVKHGDIKFLSIYANQLVQKGKEVLHGAIREVSLVLAGANPGAKIDNLAFAHADGSEDLIDDEVIIFTGEEFFIKHSTEKVPVKNEEDDPDETVADVFNTLTEKQKTVVYAMIAHAIDGVEEEDDEDMKHSEEENNKGGSKNMKHNVFDQTQDDKKGPALTHAQFSEILADAQKYGSFRESFLAHVATYGIENIEYLFPDAKTVTTNPELIMRDVEWVDGVISGTTHSPFARIKSTAADLTAETARALGYVKGELKKEEVVSLLKRITTPTTIYKKQKLDRDDIIDITDMDVVAWLKSEMRVMLNEELARAILVGDGRDAESSDRINPGNIRPIYTDDDMYAHHVVLSSDKDAEELIDEIVRSRKHYKGSGSPVLYVDADTLTDMLLLKDTLGRKIYTTINELATALRVSKIIEVPVMEGLSRTIKVDNADTVVDLKAILVNLKDYTVGADKGGQISMFDDFDIDYNQFKYLLETRCSGALTRPKSAIVVEQIQADE